MMYLCRLICADPFQPYRKVIWQNTLMGLFFGEISGEGIAILTEDAQHGNYCEAWHGVKCTNGIVTEVRYRRFAHGNFNIHALPPSTQVIWIFQCRQTFSIDTRLLPRELVTLTLSSNKIHGRIDLTTLPSRLRKAHLWGNKLSGPIDLRELPSTLLVIELRRNKIKQHTVLYDNLPMNITTISLSYPEVGEIHSVKPSRAVANKRLFRGFPPKRVN
ncbi:hypothetical protein XU18_2127 [Perkinsela sp. CCAP 1560/4]|nr:hypothetical protein XU18_3226 [Perkinsela sp. CCAP 1560/4]KNH07191.1 hypothetical protein XU18_2127 [Perkinsela sp. CCAP 1560/4]|eukprot:KNH05781.1 hypothetical protein XU18_3226 [Perkinsela sp. CCAP 1560/4]